jgi:hypothetical protein
MLEYELQRKEGSGIPLRRLGGYSGPAIGQGRGIAQSVQ